MYGANGMNEEMQEITAEKDEDVESRFTDEGLVVTRTRP
jgi:hypothetical protein